MSDLARPHDELIDGLVSDLRPVRPLPAPLLRAACWLAVVLAVALLLAMVADLAAMRHRLMAAPDLWIAAVASAATAILAAIAAF
ncbi:MAG: DUF1109 domain-containing protein, partial [Caulobacteraceae bacterium]|nr:DUF1109 domain-containing protein [Caulobacter sp.]